VGRNVDDDENLDFIRDEDIPGPSHAFHFRNEDDSGTILNKFQIIIKSIKPKNSLRKQTACASKPRIFAASPTNHAEFADFFDRNGRRL